MYKIYPIHKGFSENFFGAMSTPRPSVFSRTQDLGSLDKVFDAFIIELGSYVQEGVQYPTLGPHDDDMNHFTLNSFHF